MDISEVSGPTFRSRLVKALLMPIVLVAVLAGALLWQIHSLLLTSNSVDHSDKVLAQANSCNTQLMESDAGLRGYLITGQPAFLEPYKKVMPHVTASMDALADMVKDEDPIQLRRVNSLRSDYREWERFSREMLALHDRGGNYKDYQTNLRGELVMDSMRTVLGLIINLQQAQRDSHGKVAAAAAQNTTRRVLGLAAALGLLLAFFAQRQLRALSRSYGEALANREKLEKQLRQSQKMEAIGTLAGGIAHDFNNILGAITGYNELAVSDFPSDHPAQSHLEQVGKAVNRAKALVSQMLSFSRNAEHKPIPMALQPVIEEALDLLRAALPSAIQIRQDIDPSVPAILADPTQVHQILMNLGTNALHAMSENGGVLEVGLRTAYVDAQLARAHQELREGAYARLTVSDTGHGMDAATLDRIFEPFYTTKEQGKGTGLGLYVVHGIVKNMAGAVAAYSEPGNGTTFNIYLPVQVQEQPDDLEAMAAPKRTGIETRGWARARSGYRILFVDDEQPLVQIGQEVLRRQGYHVTASNDSIEALEVFHSRPDEFDLVITDSTMPNMNGCELAENLLQIRPDMPIILVTGFSSPVVRERAARLGITEILTKPTTGKELGDAAGRALSAREAHDAYTLG